MMKKVTIVVLGDVGRSPRMKYHALSFANGDYSVNIVGYRGTDPLQSLSSHSSVKFQYLLDCPRFSDYLPTILAYILKTLWQSITLLFALILSGVPDFILVQNPPAIPSLGVCYVFCRIVRAQFVIDWHNYAHTILAISLGANHPLVRLCRVFEFSFGRRSDKNLCVTRAMKDDLMKEHGISAITFYDRPPDTFRPTSLKDQHALILKLSKTYDIFKRNCFDNETVFTSMNEDGSVCQKSNRPGLLISSTSWTEDEDFSLLLEALQEYEDARIDGSALPCLIVAITGKGPLKEFFTEIMARRAWKHVQVITPWLEAEDYPKFLACGDLGVCLHYSSSGLDLPMKVVDMFGAGLPVCAVKFKCLSELVVHKQNGLVFERSRELSQQIQDWFKGFPELKSEQTWRSSVRVNIENFRKLRWQENWELHVKPIFS